jgi:SAM-dependent methyltransferase
VTVGERTRHGPWLRGVLFVLGRLGLLRIAFAAYERFLARATPLAGTPAPLEQTGGLPIPPPHLRVLVGGSADVESFLRIGHSMFQGLCATLAQHAARVDELDSVLDFGCGCGRVLRHWRAVAGPRIHGCDSNGKLVAWCQENLAFARCATNRPTPPLSYADGAFDLVYAVSVFTHLSEELQLAWMQELRRVLRPKGRLLITTHGASHLDRLTDAERTAFSTGRPVVRYEEASGMNLCAVYHPESYVRKRLSPGLVVEDFVPAGQREGVYQDLYLMRRDD